MLLRPLEEAIGHRARLQLLARAKEAVEGTQLDLQRILARALRLPGHLLQEVRHDILDRPLPLSFLVLREFVLDFRKHHRQKLLERLPVGLHLSLYHLLYGVGYRVEVLVRDLKPDYRIEQLDVQLQIELLDRRNQGKLLLLVLEGAVHVHHLLDNLEIYFLFPQGLLVERLGSLKIILLYE